MTWHQHQLLELQQLLNVLFTQKTMAQITQLSGADNGAPSRRRAGLKVGGVCSFKRHWCKVETLNHEICREKQKRRVFVAVFLMKLVMGKRIALVLSTWAVS